MMFVFLKKWKAKILEKKTTTNQNEIISYFNQFSFNLHCIFLCIFVSARVCDNKIMLLESCKIFICMRETQIQNSISNEFSTKLKAEKKTKLFCWSEIFYLNHNVMYE